MFKRLFAPIEIGNLELKNRIVMSPMTPGYAEADETVGDRFINFFSERAKGGAGFIIIPFAPVPQGSTIEAGLFDDRFISGIRRLTTAIHRHGAKTAVQLLTSYHIAFKGGPPEVIGPSPILNKIVHTIPRALTVEEIQCLVDEYGKSARRAREGGFDAVEIMVGGGYLLNRFLSPISNQREDEYGGSLEKRMRMILEVIGCIRKKAGSDFPISVRLNVEENMPGGHTVDKESKVVAQMLEKAGVSLINVYTGWHESPIPTIAASLPPGVFAHLAEKVRGYVGIPVIASNRINDPVVAEKILYDGKADLVGMGRALLADPELPNKAKEGRVDEIVPCIACSNCLSEVVSMYKDWGKLVATFCTVNPCCGKEGEYILKPAKKKKKVVVIGGGPAGMEAAIMAAARGHRVTLFEKGKEPGGWLRVGCLPPYKDDIRRLYKSLTVRMKKVGVQIRLNEEATPKMIEEEKPDVLILALGANPLIPDIQGVKGANVVTAQDLLTGRKTVSGSVIIVGGGLVGCETAEFLNEKGKGITRVTVLEMLGRMAENISAAARPFFMARLKKEGVQMKTGTTVLEIADRGVKVNENGAPSFIEGDAVVLAMGLKVEPGLVESFQGKAPEVYSVGDCIKPRMIKEAIWEGFSIGMKI